MRRWIMSNRFPSSLKAMRAKFPKGAIVQARIETRPGETVEFQGALGPEGSDFDKIVAAVRTHCQEPDSAPSEPGHERKSAPRGARVDTKRRAMRRESVRGEPRAPGRRGHAKKEDRVLVLYQGWEESERGWGVRPDGYSLHVDRQHRDAFVDHFLKRQHAFFQEHGLKEDGVPDEYTRVSGEPIAVSVTRAVHRQLVSRGGNYQGSNGDGARIDESHHLDAPATHPLTRSTR